MNGQFHVHKQEARPSLLSWKEKKNDKESPECPFPAFFQWGKLHAQRWVQAPPSVQRQPRMSVLLHRGWCANGGRCPGWCWNRSLHCPLFRPYFAFFLGGGGGRINLMSDCTSGTCGTSTFLVRLTALMSIAQTLAYRGSHTGWHEKEKKDICSWKHSLPCFKGHQGVILAVCGRGFWCFFLFESWWKSNEVRNKKISLREFLKNLIMFLKDCVRWRIDLNPRTS